MGMADLLTPLLFSLGLNLSLFLFAYWKRTDKLTDISYALTFASIAGFSFLISDKSAGKAIALFLVLLWAFRLGSFLLSRVVRVGKDARFDGMRENFFSFLRFWVLQAIVAWIVSFSVILLMSSPSASPSASPLGNFSIVSLIGAVLALLGLLVESIADNEKRAFSLNPKNKGKWIEEGLWKYSRHPNYLGEIAFWVGIYIFSFPNLSQKDALIALASPIVISLLLLFASGIPILEKRADEKWGKNKKYLEYKKRVPVLAPRIFPK